jgi:N-carbamoylputrescine amidase
MRVGLVPLEVRPQLAANLARMVSWANRLADEGVRIVVFPEACLTGLVNDDDPARDLPLGSTLPGPVTEVLGTVARGRGILLAFGLLERDEERLFDTAVLLDERGEVALRYRRITPGWHGRLAVPSVYGQGYDLPVAETSIGRVACLLCGDLFDDDLADRVRDVAPDWLLHPLWRSMDGAPIPQRWAEDEEAAYAARVARIGCKTLMVNARAHASMAGGAVGGAWVRGRDGAARAELAIGEAGALIADVAAP